MDRLNTISIKKCIYLESTASTNAYLSEYISKNNPQTNMCTYTFKQTEGKGQIGRNWFSDVNKNITLSYLIHFKNLDIQNQFQLNMTISIGVLEFLKKYINAEDIYIKWPNDIYIKNKKIAGVLIQNQLKGRLISSSIIGIGLNINQDVFPRDLPNPTSLLIETAKEWDKITLVHELKSCIINALHNLRFTPKSLLKKYLENFYRINQLYTFTRKNNNSEFNGVIKGVTAEGKLLIDIDDNLEAFNFREISFVI